MNLVPLLHKQSFFFDFLTQFFHKLHFYDDKIKSWSRHQYSILCAFWLVYKLLCTVFSQHSPVFNPIHMLNAILLPMSVNISCSFQQKWNNKWQKKSCLRYFTKNYRKYAQESQEGQWFLSTNMLEFFYIFISIDLSPRIYRICCGITKVIHMPHKPGKLLQLLVFNFIEIETI